MWALLHYRLGWTVQRPKRRAAERDQDAIDHWLATEWPRIKANAHRRRAWLVVERLPAYAPELNPVEALWSSLKAVELAHLTSPTLAEGSPSPSRRPTGPPDPHLAYAFLRHAGLSVA